MWRSAIHFGAPSKFEETAFHCLDIVQGDFWLFAMVNHHKTHHLGGDFFTFSKHLKQIQDCLSLGSRYFGQKQNTKVAPHER